MSEKYAKKREESDGLVTPERYGAAVLRRFQLLPTQEPGEPLGINMGHPDGVYYFPNGELEA